MPTAPLSSEPARPGESRPDAAARVDLRDTLRLLRRRRWLMLGICLTVLLLTLLVLQFIPPRYTATAKVVIDPRQNNVVDLEQVMSGLPVNAEMVQSEIEVLTSTDLAAQVVARAGLAAIPEFNPSLAAPGFGDWARQKFGLPSEEKPETLEDVARKVAARYRAALQVKVAGRSRVINISFTAGDPDLAARIANTTAALYLSGQVAARLDATVRASKFLNDRLTQLRQDVEAAELLVARTQAENQANPPVDAGTAAVHLRTLEQQAEASRVLYETFLTRAKETGEQTGLTENGLVQGDARLISPAEAPVTPSFPDRRLALLLALVSGLGLALAAAFLAEQFDHGFRSSDQIAAALGLPTIARLPSLRSLGIRNQTPEAYLVAKPASAFAESVRMLRTALLLANPAAPPKLFMVTSALPGEGKTTTVLALARLAALAGEKVLVIDADIRCPRIHAALGVDNKVGLVDVLMKRAKLEAAVRKSEAGGKHIHYLSAGGPLPETTEILRLPQLKLLLSGLRDAFDLVLIDSPPVLPVADAQLLATLAERVIYVVKWNGVRREVVAHALKQLRDSGAGVAGVVLNNLDVREHAAYSYGDSGYYSGAQRKYYTE